MHNPAHQAHTPQTQGPASSPTRKLAVPCGHEQDSRQRGIIRAPVTGCDASPPHATYHMPHISPADFSLADWATVRSYLCGVSLRHPSTYRAVVPVCHEKLRHWRVYRTHRTTCLAGSAYLLTPSGTTSAAISTISAIYLCMQHARTQPWCGPQCGHVSHMARMRGYAAARGLAVRVPLTKGYPGLIKSRLQSLCRRSQCCGC